MFEKEAEEYAHTKYCEKCSTGHCEKKCVLVEDDCKTFKDGAEFVYNKSKAEIALLSQHILDLQKDKGNLTDKVRELEAENEQIKNSDTLCKLIGEQKRKIAELEAQIEKMKRDVKGNIKWADQNKNDQMWQKLVKMYNQWS